MKKKAKGFLAALMAVAMLLSLTVTASASTVSGGTFTPQTVNSGGAVRNLPTSGGIDADSTSEGPLPDDPIEVVLPTIPTIPSRDDGVNSGGTFGLYDIILDPHGLINKTEGARYDASGTVKKTFSDSRLYFLKSFTETAQAYDGESKSLEIINKGRQPVNVNLSLDFTYDKNDFTLVDDIAKVTISGDTITSGDTQIISSGDDVYDGAAMYLALQVGTGDDKTTHPIYNPRLKAAAAQAAGEANYTKYYDIPIITVSGKGDYIMATPDVTVMNDQTSTVYFGWTATDDAKVDALLEDISKLAVTLSYAAPVMSGDTVETPATITISPAFDASVSSKYSFDTGTGSENTVSGDVISVTGTGYTAGYNAFTIKSTTSGDTLATVGVQVMKPDAKTMKATEGAKNTNQIINFKAPQNGVVVQTAIEGNDAYYSEKWVNPSTASGDAYQGMTAAGYYWKLQDGLTNADFPTLTFRLIGNINDDAMWDYMSTTPDITFELIWDVMQRSTYYKNVDYGNSEVEIVEAPGGGNTPRGDQPTVAVTQTATTGRGARALILTWTPGTEDYLA